MTCRKCKQELQTNTPFCPWCGTQQAKPKQHTRTRPNGAGYAVKRGKTWTAVVTVAWETDEHRVKRPIKRSKGGFATKREALEHCPMLKGTAPKPVRTLDYYWKQYSTSDLDKLSDSKQTAYQIAFNKIYTMQFNSSPSPYTQTPNRPSPHSS